MNLPRRWLPLFGLCLLFGPSLRAAEFGRVVNVFPINSPRLLADPVRHAVYALNSNTNSVVVIDTDTLTIKADLPIGSKPVDMAISPDGEVLYVANSGSTEAAVGIIDLKTLTVRPSYALPEAPLSLAAVGNNALAVVTSDHVLRGLNFLTKKLVTLANPKEYKYDLIRINPVDDLSLFAVVSQVTRNDNTAKVLSRYALTGDYSAQQTVEVRASQLPLPLTISLDGKYLCASQPKGNPFGFSTTIYSTADLNNYYGTLDTGLNVPGPLAFAPDSKSAYLLGYQYTYAEDTFSYPLGLQAFSLQSFASTGQRALPLAAIVTQNAGFSIPPPDAVVDATGSYVFVTGLPPKAFSFKQLITGSIQTVAVVATGQGTLTPPAITPEVNVLSDENTLSAAAKEKGAFYLTRTGDLSQPLTVRYKVNGSAVSGVDYKPLKGTATIKAGELATSVKVKSLAAGQTKAVKLGFKLVGDPAYKIGPHKKGKIMVGP